MTNQKIFRWRLFFSWCRISNGIYCKKRRSSSL